MSKKVSKEETNLEWTQICNIRSSCNWATGYVD